MKKNILRERLEKLGWTPWELAKRYTIHEGQPPHRDKIRGRFSTIQRALNNPENVSFGIIQTLIALVGGEIQYVWHDFPQDSEEISVQDYGDGKECQTENSQD